MKLHVLHETRYDYQPAVENAQHVVHLKPMAHASQRLISHELRVSPTPARLRESLDVYGNACHYFSFQNPHAELVVTSESLVQTLTAPELRALPPPAWARVRAPHRSRAGARWAPAPACATMLLPTSHAPASPPAARWPTPPGT